MSKSFTVSLRDAKLNNHQLRKEGIIPCIIYGKSIDSTPIQIDKKVLLTMFRENSRGSVIPLDLNGEVKDCVVKEIQKDNFGHVIHMDFEQIDKNQKIKLEISINFNGQDYLAEKGLVFEAVHSSIEFHGKASEIPESLEFDVTKMGFDDKILVSDIKLPEGVSIQLDPEEAIAVVRGGAPVQSDSEEEVVAE